MQKLSKENMLTQLMIRLDQLESKIDKLLNEREVYLKSPEIKIIGGKPGEGRSYIDPEKIMICMACMMGDGREHSKEHCSLSDEEIFREEMK